MILSPSPILSAVGLIAIAVWFPVTMLTASGISNTRASYLDVARTLGGGRAYLIFRVAIPAAMPSIFIGLFMGLGIYAIDTGAVWGGKLTALLRNAVARREPGVNVLLYGPPGTGKTELAKVAAQAAGLELYEVEYADRDGNSLSGRDRYRSLQISQVFLKGSATVALLFDEVEDVFPPISTDAAQFMARLDTGDGMPSGSVSGKAWVNQILETNPVPVIWVTNRIEQIDPAFRRRFAYHLELKSPPPGAREQLVRKTLEGVSVSDAFTAKLAERNKSNAQKG